MKKYPVLYEYLKLGKCKLLLLPTIIILLLVAGCTSSRKNQHNLHRRPASKGQKDCGCQLVPADSKIITTDQQPIYALQA